MIARVQGSAFGVGLALIACADVAIVVPEALFGFSDVKLGWAPAVIAPYVQRAIGTRATRRYFVTAERFNARKAKRLGLIHQIVAANELDHTVNMLIQHVKHNSPQAIAAAKRLLHELEPTDETVQLVADFLPENEPKPNTKVTGGCRAPQTRLVNLVAPPKPYMPLHLKKNSQRSIRRASPSGILHPGPHHGESDPMRAASQEGNHRA